MPVKKKNPHHPTLITTNTSSVVIQIKQLLAATEQRQTIVLALGQPGSTATRVCQWVYRRAALEPRDLSETGTSQETTAVKIQFSGGSGRKSVTK